MEVDARTVGAYLCKNGAKKGAKEWRKRMAQTPLERRCMAA